MSRGVPLGDASQVKSTASSIIGASAGESRSPHRFGCYCSPASAVTLMVRRMLPQSLLLDSESLGSQFPRVRKGENCTSLFKSDLLNWILNFFFLSRQINSLDARENHAFKETRKRSALIRDKNAVSTSCLKLLLLDSSTSMDCEPEETLPFFCCFAQRMLSQPREVITMST